CYAGIFQVFFKKPVMDVYFTHEKAPFCLFLPEQAFYKTGFAIFFIQNSQNKANKHNHLAAIFVVIRQKYPFSCQKPPCRSPYLSPNHSTPNLLAIPHSPIRGCAPFNEKVQKNKKHHLKTVPYLKAKSSQTPIILDFAWYQTLRAYLSISRRYIIQLF
ncbi:hypothetical protein SAMN02745221_02215, partial [Thermosyntropha lipolytica DSM 11003]